MIDTITEVENLTFNVIKNQTPKIQHFSLSIPERELIRKALIQYQNRINTDYKKYALEHDLSINILKKI